MKSKALFKIIRILVQSYLGPKIILFNDNKIYVEYRNTQISRAHTEMILNELGRNYFVFHWITWQLRAFTTRNCLLLMPLFGGELNLL